jgi:hypothetical protein
MVRQPVRLREGRGGTGGANAGTGETWKEVGDRIIDRYEAARARNTLQWGEWCAECNREKAEVVARTKAAMAEQAQQQQQ